MEHLDNNMDELFRKAGELYPLKITGSDWDGVAGKIRDENIEDPAAIHGSGRKGASNRRRWRLLLILIPFVLAGLVYTSKFIQTDKAGSVPVSIKSKPVASSTATENKPGSVNPPAGGEPISSDAASISTARQLQSKKENTDLSKTAAQGRIVNRNEKDISEGNAGTQSAGGDPRLNNNKLSKNNNSPDAGDLSAKNISSSETSGYYPETFHEPVAKPISLSVYGPNETVSVYGMPILQQSSNVSTPGNLQKKTTKPAAAGSKGIYAGFRLGPDVSTVKFQSVEQLGFSLGILVGYRFNKQLAIETGLMWDKKYYYSKGEYFNTKNITVPQYATIVDVVGNCNMWEIPFTLRYDFSTTKNHGYFAKAGFSSYIMKKQNYKFNLSDPSHQWETPYKPYNNTLKYFFATIQLSGGYERAISEKTKIRIEPYVNIPLQGVGTGSLPISSAGLYLGISYSFR